MLFLASIRDALLALEEGQGETYKQLQAVLFHQGQEVGAVTVEGHNVFISNMVDKAVTPGHFAFQIWNFSLTQTESCGEVAEGEDVSSCKLLPSFQDRRLWWLYWQDDPDILKIISSRWQSRFVDADFAFQVVLSADAWSQVLWTRIVPGAFSFSSQKMWLMMSLMLTIFCYANDFDNQARAKAIFDKRIKEEMARMDKKEKLE